VTALGADEVLTVVRDVIVRVMECDPAAVTADARLAQDLRADSVALVAIADLIEDRLRDHAPAGWRIEDEALDDIATVGQARDYILRTIA
jgi:acyl carrier protein